MYPLEQALTAVWPPDQWQDLTVLLAVSGGSDSVALLRAAGRLKTAGAGRLIVGHYHHGLRGEADNDERFVRHLCRDLDVELHVGRGDVAVTAEREGDGLEAAARRDRYDFLRTTAEQLGARYLATAHTADDQVETILHHIIRGTGLAGLAGMPRVRQLSSPVTLVRPLLTIRRLDVSEYLSALGQDYCQDQSNTDRRFVRNRIRHDLLPLLVERFSASVGDAVLRLGQLASEAQAVIDTLVDEHFERCVTSVKPQQVCLQCQSLLDVPPYLVRELLIRVWRDQGWPLQDMSLAQWDRLAEATVAEDTKLVLPGNVTVAKKDGQLVMTR